VIKALAVQSRKIRRSTLKKNSKSPIQKEQKAKRAKAQRPVQREAKEVLAELVEKLQGKLEVKATSASPAEAGPQTELGPNLDRLTVGVDWGDQRSHFCILGLPGETRHRMGSLERRLGAVDQTPSFSNRLGRRLQWLGRRVGDSIPALSPS